jgi:HSP20 family protein
MANITRYNPFDELFKDFGKGFWVKPLPFPAETALEMKIDVKEDEKSYTISAEIPGAKRDDIKVDVEGNLVSVRAEVRKETDTEKEAKKGEKVVYSERSYGMASRSFTLPAEVEAKGAKAEYKDGLLSLTLPKKANGGGQRVAIS